MSNGLAEYQAMQEQVRRLHQEIGAIAAEISEEAESLRSLAESAAAVAERRVLAFGPVIEMALSHRRTATLQPITTLLAQLRELEAAQISAAQRYEQLSAEERVGQIPASVPPAKGSC
jgi:hypothetical protein